jgi:hypothetical protein
VLSYEAMARDLTPDHVLARVLSTVPAPRIAPSQDPARAQLIDAAPASPDTWRTA